MKAIFFLLSSIFVLQRFSLTKASSLENSCMKAKKNSHVDYDFCVTSLQVDPKSRNADAKGLACIANKLTQDNFTYIKSKAEHEQFSMDVVPTNMYNGALRNCVILFKDGIKCMDLALHYIESGDISGALKVTKNVTKIPDWCDEMFSKPPWWDFKSPLLKDTEIARKLINIFQTFTSFLIKK